MKKFLLILIVVFSIPVLGYLNYQSGLAALEPENLEESSFFVRRGQTAEEIGQALSEAGLIKSPFSFKTYLKLNKLGEGIIAGRFFLSPSMDVEKIVETISDPSAAEFIITIQEGLRVVDIDNRLVELGLTENGEFEEAAKNFNGWQYYSFLDKGALENLKFPIEGYIFPDTYFLDPTDFEAHDLIYLALDNFERRTKDLIPEIKRHSVNEIITMASIIENEVFGEKDRALVSGIFWKRLANNWTLGADATLLYITDDRTITVSDLQIDSPYNTRKNLGLPPGPISNPSLSSIKASMYPESSEYWFYLTTLDTGEVIYARSNEEHNINRAKYL